MRTNGSFRPWRRHTASYLVPAHPIDGQDDNQQSDDEDEAIAKALLQRLVPVNLPPLAEEQLRAVYLHGWRDGYSAGFRAGLAQARKRGHRKGTRSLGALTLTSPFDGGLHERSRYHL